MFYQKKYFLEHVSSKNMEMETKLICHAGSDSIYYNYVAPQLLLCTEPVWMIFFHRQSDVDTSVCLPFLICKHIHQIFQKLIDLEKNGFL